MATRLNCQYQFSLMESVTRTALVAFDVECCFFFSRQRILVNRGWVPKERIEPQKRQEGQVMSFAWFCLLNNVY